VNTWWFAAFHAVSSFNNAGFVLLSSNLAGFATDKLFLFVTSIEILLGYCMAPVAIRLIVWILHHYRQNDRGLELLLNHPRLCFTHMFASETTWMLAFWIFMFTASEVIIFLWADWDTPAFSMFTGSEKGMIAYFQAVSTRTAGFNVININDTSPPHQFMQFLWMYLAIYPMLLSFKRSRRNEHNFALKTPTVAQTALSTTSDSPVSTSFLQIDNARASNETSSASSDDSDKIDFSGFYIRKQVVVLEEEGTLDAYRTVKITGHKPLVAQIQSMVSEEITATCLAIFAVILDESNMLRRPTNPTWMSIWGVLFEVSSAYGTCGLTLSTHAISLSGFFTPFSKFMIIIVMIAGRHRGLPHAMDPKIGIHWDKLKQAHKQAFKN
jgi:Trk-type K+ transport system membrane component